MCTSLGCSHSHFEQSSSSHSDPANFERMATRDFPKEASVSPQDHATVIIHRSQLYAECLMHAVAEPNGDTILTFPKVETWIDIPNWQAAALVVLCVSGLSRDEEAQQINALLSCTEGLAPVVIMGDSESPDYVVSLLARGCHGYIPTSLSLNMTVKALSFVRSGGVFIPAEILLASQLSHKPNATDKQSDLGMFTAKQSAVIEAIRLGKANKTIAYELNMCESTVKVHVRNIMKKLDAKNRTQVAFIANQMAR